MTSMLPDSPAQTQREPCLCVRVIARDAAGTIHLEWPADQIAAAIEDAEATVWIDIEDPVDGGDKSVEVLLREVFQFHPLAIEDALKDTHIPKVDDWDKYLYLVFSSIDFDPHSDVVRLHELDIFLGRNYLVTYHKEPLKVIEQQRRNIQREPNHRLKHGADRLLYNLLDMAVAEYLPAIEHLDEAIDRAQEEVFHRPGPRTLQAIFRVKRSALRLHRILSPEREVLNRLARDAYDLIDTEHRVYFRDVYDHIVRIHDIAESLRDLISSALDTYLSAISNRTNEIMKTLTLVTVMFLPMSFLAGFFGMNFFGETLAFRSHLPKGFLFFCTCSIMFVTPWAMWIWAKKRRWF